VNKAFIRPATASDLPYLYRICLLTGYKGTDASDYYSDPFLLGQYYVAPYFFYEPECCFVLETTQEHTVAGYIAGTSDTRGFIQWRNRSWLLQLARRCNAANEGQLSGPETELRKLIVNCVSPDAEDKNIRRTIEQSRTEQEYPAHFHIDILPDLQHLGFGHELVLSFTENLRLLHIHGVHLGVDKGNLPARAFYKKEGFSDVLEEKEYLLLGKKIS